jgi:DNA processing protein
MFRSISRRFGTMRELMSHHETSRQTTALLEFLQWPRVGPARAREIARTTGSNGTSDLLEIARQRTPEVLVKLAESRQGEIRDAASRILENCSRHSISVLSLVDKEYPERLRKIEDAPPIIYVRGELAALNGPAVAVVGTRKASESGRRAARVIAQYLAKRRISVVSGLALGIDAAAHTGALEGGGVTVAILAHGLDIIAPTSNKPIAEQLLAHGGALISEHQPGVPPRPAEFARRNRIQSGMSMCSIVVESGETGGAIIQATFTRDQGRPLLTVMSRQGQKSDLNEEGARLLVEKFGALAITGTSDLAAALHRIEATGTEPPSTEPARQNEMEW